MDSDTAIDRLVAAKIERQAILGRENPPMLCSGALPAVSPGTQT